MSDYIRRKDAIRAVLRNDGEATVARIQDLPVLDLDKLKSEIIERLCQHCDTTREEKLKEECCASCPIINEVKEAFANE